MTLFLMIAFIFFIGSTLGWCLEVLYRRFCKANKNRKWINPGFMIGPYLPLYGFGLTALYLMAGIEKTGLITEITAGSRIILFIIMAVVMTVIEYIAGLIFIKGMKVKLWDYSGEKFNLQGIICLKFSCYWAVLSAVYYFFIHPHIDNALLWFSQNITFSFSLGLFYGVMLVDLVYSLGIVKKVRSFAVENKIMVRYEELKMEIRQTAAARMEKSHWLLQFKSEVPLREHLMRYIEIQETFWVKDKEERYSNRDN